MYALDISLRPRRASRAFEDALRTLPTLTAEIARLIREGHRRGILAGLDADGEPMERLSPVTLATRPGSGPPLAPREMASRILRNFRLRTTLRKDGLRFSMFWVAIPWVRFHVQGTKNMPRRNPAGIRPKDLALIRRAVDRHFGGSATATYAEDVRVNP